MESAPAQRLRRGERRVDIPHVGKQRKEATRVPVVAARADLDLWHAGELHEPHATRWVVRIAKHGIAAARARGQMPGGEQARVDVAAQRDLPAEQRVERADPAIDVAHAHDGFMPAAVDGRCRHRSSFSSMR
ncbi:MAG: hypothetical protein R3E65_08125 [Steroidobacteraceae bacterium]